MATTETQLALVLEGAWNNRDVKVGMMLRNTNRLSMNFLMRYQYPAFHALYRGIEAYMMIVLLRRLATSGKRTRVILDAGCGDGTLFDLLNPIFGSKACRVGIDISPLAVRSAKKSYDEVVVCDLERTPFREETFDLIICNSVIEHLDHPSSVISNISGLLKPMGESILTTITKHFESYYWLTVLTGQRAIKSLIKRFEHKFHFTREGLMLLLTQNKLTPIYVVSTHGPGIMAFYHILRFIEEDLRSKSLILRITKRFVATLLFCLFVQLPITCFSDKGADIFSVSGKEVSISRHQSCIPPR